MFDLGPYSEFIIASYSLSALTLITLTLWVHQKERHHLKILSLLNEEEEEKSSQGNQQ